MRNPILTSVLLAAATLACAASLRAQCTLGSSEVGPVAGVDGTVRAIVSWDPDGAGPASPLLVVAGEFTHAGGQSAPRIATVDPATGGWSSLGAGLPSACRALTVGANNNLLVATQLGVLEWNGAGWSPLGTGSPINGYAIAARSNGQVVVGGAFGAKVWSGGAWSQLPFAAGSVYALTRMPNDDVVFGGSFNSVGGVAATHIVRWDGSTWSALGGGSPGAVTALAVDQNGELLAGGAWVLPGTNWEVARWSGGTWTTIGIFWGTVNAIAVDATGDVFAGGSWSGGGIANPPQRRSAGGWSNLCGYEYDGHVFAIGTLPSGSGVLVGGNFTLASSMRVDRVFRWQGAPAPVRPAGPSGTASVVTGLSGGQIAVADTVGSAHQVWVGEGATWAALGAPFASPIRGLAELPNGDLLAVGANPAAMRWDGAAWAPATNGLTGTIEVLVERENGELLVGGSGGVHEWNGTGWAARAPATSDVRDLAILPDGRMALLRAPGGVTVVETWQPGASQATPLPSVSNTIRDLELDADGTPWLGCVPAWLGGPDVGLYRWTGAAWQGYVVDGPVRFLRRMPDGSMVRAEYVDWQTPAFVSYVYRHSLVDPTNWSMRGYWLWADLKAAGVGDDGAPLFAGRVPNGPLALTSSCPSAITSTPSGCSGVGSAALQTANQPVVDGEWHAWGTGLQQPAIVATVTAFSAATQPLSALTPLAATGCQVHVATDDFVHFQVALDGTAHRWFRIPLQVAALAGLEYHQQMLVMELDAAGAYVGATATNSLSMTIGWY